MQFETLYFVRVAHGTHATRSTIPYYYYDNYRIRSWRSDAINNW